MSSKRPALPSIIANRKGEWVQMRLNELNSSTYTARALVGRAQENVDILLDRITSGEVLPLFVCNQTNDLLGGHRSKWALELGGLGTELVDVYRIETSDVQDCLVLVARLNEEQIGMDYSKDDIQKQVHDMLGSGMSKKEVVAAFDGSPLQSAVKRALMRLQQDSKSVEMKAEAMREALAHKLEGRKLNAFLRSKGLTDGQMRDVLRAMEPDLRHNYQRRADGWGTRQKVYLHKLFEELVRDRNDGRLTTSDIRTIFDGLRKELGQIYQALGQQEARLKAPVAKPTVMAAG